VSRVFGRRKVQQPSSARCSPPKLSAFASKSGGAFHGVAALEINAPTSTLNASDFTQRRVFGWTRRVLIKGDISGSAAHDVES
jgi:hypothetical protein